LNTQKLVFVVDDDPSILKSAERLLKAHGFQAQVFASAEDFQQSAALDDGMCLIVDIHLSGKSGIELRRELTMSQVSLPVIFITGDDNEGIRSAAYSVGCVARSKAYTIETRFRPLVGFADIAGDDLGRLVPRVALDAIGRHVACRGRGRVAGARKLRPVMSSTSSSASAG
jgi:CheY-like chemotaxis protein